MNNKIELRVHDVMLRAKEDGSMTVSGYVNHVGKLSNVLGSAKKFVEKIAPGAFSRAIKNAKYDIDFLAEHDSKKILASTRNQSLLLYEDEIGLFMSANIVPTSYGKDYYELIGSGILRNMSFGFRTVRDSWKQSSSGLAERTIHELELFEVSAVKNPAYSQSTLSARSIEIIENPKIPTNLEKGKFNQMNKQEFRYGTSQKTELEIRKESEIREFNDNLRNLQMTSGSEAIIPETVANTIVAQLDEVSPVFARAKKFHSVSGSLKIPRETAVSLGAFVGEGQNLIEESMSLSEISLSQKRVGSYMALTRQLINDAAIQMEGYIPSLLARQVHKAVERSMLRGSKAEEFRGIVPNEDIQSFNVTADAGDEQLLDVLLDLVLNVHPEYIAKSQFIMSRPFFNRVSKLRDAAGHFYTQNGSVNGKPTQTLFGLEVIISSSLENGDAAGQTPVILGSLEDGYALMIKKGAQMTMVQDTDHALRGSVGFLFDVYLDGAVYNPDAFSKLVIA
ncbi:phage major capsid protein [Metabacillus idriensis]|uniref:phage major capsid protein n=1 Tax=Metabacillus idriensis TaxID=324768 RepID=UPI00174EA87F|nr:phage major capsid protein [Metabacillus idriensis]